MSDDKIVYLKHRLKLTKKPVVSVCEIAGDLLEDVVIMGKARDGTIKMMTTQPDSAELLYYLETAKYALLSGEMDED